MGGFQYFGEREAGPGLRERDEIDAAFWGGVVVAVNVRVDDGSLAEAYPRLCTDSPVIAATDEQALGLAIRAEHPQIQWPLVPDPMPPTVAALEFVEFIYSQVSTVVERDYHGFYRHNHYLAFDKRAGQLTFRDAINRLFRRNRLAFELQENGEIRRTLDRAIAAILDIGPFRTGDNELDRLLTQARDRFTSPDPEQRRDSLEKVWDAWQRIKTLLDPDTRRGIDALLRAAAPDAEFRNLLNADGRSLTDIGNDFMIRHTETTKMPVREMEYVDYLFHRMYALVWLLLKRINRLH